MDFVSRCKRNGNTIVIPDDVYFIPKEAFSMDKTIEKVVIGRNVSFIEEMAFAFCENLIEVYFDPCSICKIIGYGAFMFCKNLEKINLPNSLSKIEGMTFLFNKKLKKIVIPPSVNIIDALPFALSNIEHIVFLSDRIHYIDNRSFSGAETLKKITICGIDYDVYFCEGLEVYKIGKEKRVQNILIQKNKDIRSKFNQNIDDVWWICYDINKEKYTYGKDMRTTYNELRQKLSNNISELATNEYWTMDTKINIEQYSLMSDNCWHNIKIFMNEFGYNENDKLSIREIYKISRTQRNFRVFEDFINKYIIKDDGTRNGVKVNLKEESSKNE